MSHPFIPEHLAHDSFKPETPEQMQRMYCSIHRYPEFAMTICPSCSQDIYKSGIVPWSGGPSAGFTEDQAKNTHITYCPHCKHSFTD